MEGELWLRGKSLAIFFVFALMIQGIQPDIQSALECYSCIDQGDHGCSMEKAMKVKCQEGQENVCMEAVYTVQASHGTHTITMKACGASTSGQLNKTESYHGLTLFIQVKQCNTSLCNAEADLEYQLSPSGNSSQNSSGLQCHSCIGKVPGQCLPSNAPVVDCLRNESYCFDGNATITIKNITLDLPIKSCSTSSVCSKLSKAWAGVSLTMLGACCFGNKCNQDLSQNIQYGNLPPLILIPRNPLTTPGLLDNVTGLNTTEGAPSNTSTTHLATSISESSTIKAISEAIISQTTKQTQSTGGTTRVISCIWSAILLAALTL
ncbi:ly6/PLAUR domain-containing protein 3-like [Rhinatrema bivittatum]|uniref:ly6/PLAUR domain-containing protein 3-like n=1 Tax=Rhinatrema bivittatum TaxID=194408 RepID=UPI00112D3FA9|nr:ly6/PLAUR domain-containing protein 3-like [Rhinatrema bivittatum]